MKKGFTLIELLAVIVILAIIALIATPIILNIIGDTKKSSQERSIDLYGRAVEQAVARYQLNSSKKATGRFQQSNEGKTLTEQDPEDSENPIIISVDYSGEKVECGIINIDDNGQVSMSSCKVNGAQSTYEYGVNNSNSNSNGGNDSSNISVVEATLISGEETRGQIGAEYSIKVNNEETNNTFNFYILSTNTDGTTNLIMDRNICADGSVLYSASNGCRCAWNSSSDSNIYGPTTAMTVVYNGTMGWTNIPAMNLTDYTDAGDQPSGTSTTYGYNKIEIVNGIATITAKDASTTIIGTSQEPLRARLPKRIEVIGEGKCGEFSSSNNNTGSCPEWLVENLRYAGNSLSPGANYSINDSHKNDATSKIYGYWLLSSTSANSSSARYVYLEGNVRSNASVRNEGTNSSNYGARPVITIPSSALE